MSTLDLASFTVDAVGPRRLPVLNLGPSGHDGVTFVRTKEDCDDHDPNESDEHLPLENHLGRFYSANAA